MGVQLCVQDATQQGNDTENHKASREVSNPRTCMMRSGVIPVPGMMLVFFAWASTVWALSFCITLFAMLTANWPSFDSFASSNFSSRVKPWRQ